MAGIIWNGSSIEQAIMSAAMEAAHLGAEAILTEAIDEAPLLSGTMERSGSITDVPSECAIYVSFNTPYARKQHEDLTLRHTNGRKAKYLEDPFKRNINKVLKLINKRVSEKLGGLG